MGAAGLSRVAVFESIMVLVDSWRPAEHTIYRPTAMLTTPNGEELDGLADLLDNSALDF
jgi:hypothetical protein